MINRGALIVRLKQPYLDWAGALDDSGLLPSVDEDQTVYLVPSFDDDKEAEAILNRLYKRIFEDQLFAWHTDEESWPKTRTFSVFKKWFHIEWHSEVEDLCADEIIEEDGYD